MQDNISERLLRRLTVRTKPYEVRDQRLKGFLLRVEPGGTMTYFVQYARGKRAKIGRADAIRPERAREEASKILARAQLGEDPAVAKSKAQAHTLSSFVDEVYAPWVAVHLRSHKNTLLRLRRNFPSLQSTKLHDISPRVVEQCREQRLKAGRKASTINRDLDDLKSLLRKAVAWGYLDQFPLRDVKRSRVDDRARIRFLSDEERRALLVALDQREEGIRAARDNANTWRKARGYELLPNLRKIPFADYLKPLVLISLNTGMRQGEAFHLRWVDVDLSRSLLTVGGATSKSRQTRHIPLNSIAKQTLVDWSIANRPNTPNALVFPGKAGRPLTNTRRSWLRVLSDAGICNFRWHDLRHTFASRLVMSGVDLNTVRELMGHSTIAMTLRYAHLAPEHKAKAVERLV